MAYANDDLYQPPSVDFGTPRQPARRYSDGMPVPGLYGSPLGVSGMGLYGVGMGATLKMNTDLPSQVAAAKNVDAGITRLLSAINQAGAMYAGILSGTAQEGVLAAAKTAVAELQSIQGELQAAITAGSKEYGSYQGSTDAWNAMESAIQKAKGALTTYDAVAGQVAQAGQAAQAARAANEKAAIDAANAARAQTAADQAAALRQQQADMTTVNSAITRATTFAGQRNYAAALAALQAADVVGAATRIGRAGDLETAVAAVAGQQAQVEDANRRLLEQQAACTQQGGAWAGTFCDFSARDAARGQESLASASAKVDLALSQADAQASAGTSGGFRAALMILASAMADATKIGRGYEIQVLQADIQQRQAEAQAAEKAARDAAAAQAQRDRLSARVDAAISQANNYAANGGYDVALSVLNGVMGAAVEAGRSEEVIAAQSAIQQARAAGTTGSTGGGTQQTNAELLAFQRECLAKGGLWDGMNCDLSLVREREEVERQRREAQEAERRKEDRLMSLLSNPLFMTNPAVQAQVLAQILAAYGIDPSAGQQGGGMAQNVPGGGGSQFVANTGQYAGPFGEERF